MACGRYRGRRGGRRDVGSDVLGVRRPVVWSFSVDDFDSSWFSGATSCFVLLPRHAGLSDRAQAGSFGLRALVASFVEVVLGTKYSVSLVVIALLQAAAAEAVFALFRYRRWTLGVTILSALAIGIVYNFYLLFFYYQHSHSSAREASSALFASCLARWHSPVSVPGECIALYVSQVFCRDSLPRIRNITKKTPESTFDSMPRPF